MFKEDFEFAEGHMSHLHTAPSQESRTPVEARVESRSPEQAIASTSNLTNTLADNSNQVVLTPLAEALEGVSWSADGEAELKKIPFFVRGKIKRNTEKFASDRGITSITSETLYEAKAAIGK